GGSAAKRGVEREVAGAGRAQPRLDRGGEVGRARRRDVQPRQRDLAIEPVFEEAHETRHVVVAEEPVRPRAPFGYEEPALRPDVGEFGLRVGEVTLDEAIETQPL